jgi:uncharacterized protein
MSPGRSDQVNAVELAGRAAVLERELGLKELPRLLEAGALEGTRVRATLAFGRFEGRTTIELKVAGRVMLRCQRCLKPCERAVDEQATLVIVRDDRDDVPGGFEGAVGDAEHLPVGELIEEQVLLGLPSVPLHEDDAGCGTQAARETADDAESEAGETYRPFENLRDMLD